MKYTWCGDSDLNEAVEFEDYVRIDTSLNGQFVAWLNGNPDLSGGPPDFDD